MSMSSLSHVIVPAETSRRGRVMDGRGGVERPEELRRLILVKRQSRRQGASRRLRHGARFGACVALVALLIAACSSARPAGQSPGFTGHDWQVVTISHDETARSIPSRLQVFLQFSPDGHFNANDSVNFRSGAYRATATGFTVGGMGTTLAGYAGHDPIVLLAIKAIGSFNDGVHATAKLTGDRLVVGVASYTLTCQRRGRHSDPPARAGTGGY